MKIIIACGGTGGHIFPGVSLYRSLTKIQAGADILLALDKREASDSIVGDEFRRVYLALTPLRFKLDLQSVVVVLKLFKGVFQSLRVIIAIRPDVVVGFGGYASFFLVFFARVFRIKTIIHEQNVMPGRANRILAYISDKVAVGFSGTKDYFGVNSSKVALTGNPLRQDLIQLNKAAACDFLGLSSGKFTILVMGGSQGAHKINSVFFQAVSLLERKSEFQVIHLCGEKDYLWLKNGYGDAGISARAFSFFGAMENAYSAADMVISRAGAVTISEVASFGLPLILIPYLYAHGHQIQNAAYVAKNNAAILIEEKDLYPEFLRDKVLELFHRPELRESMGRNISRLHRPGASESLAGLVLND
ncbi:undecaprenyldiphospho-muramoylpentapeptide beta-N-acetylglucosaminyltransferase [Candidatus Omnitrophota bacterium]